MSIPEALPRSCISIARYAVLTGYSECALNGVNAPTDVHGDCENPIWSQYQRDTLLYYLSEAQMEIEQVTGYPLCATYFENEQHPYRFPVHADWTKLLTAGRTAETTLAAGTSVNYAADPAVIGPLATTVTDPNEIKIFHPGSEREIEPSLVSIAGGNVTIEIPRCRLVDPAVPVLQGGLAWDDTDNFIATVDVKRVYLDTSVNAKLVWFHRAAEACPSCGCLTCGEYTADGCLVILNPETGAMGAVRASFNDGWTPTCGHCYSSRPDAIRLYYQAGLSARNLQVENAVLRLAHAKMPSSICGCDVLRSMWERDTRIPEVLTSERENCPFGMSDGAWTAWKFANAAASRRMSSW